METGIVIAALDSDLRRQILRILSKEAMTVVQVLEELKKHKSGVKYRETAYRALEKLLEAGIVDKSYVRNKGLCYELIVSRITIDLATDSLEKSG
jgi:Fe2+ or Zn2+ uptake regulation protein